MKPIVNFFINILIFILSIFIPKDKRLAVVGGWRGKRFADNSKYFFLEYCNLYRSQYELWWITRDKKIYVNLKRHGCNVLMCNSCKSFWIHIRAKYHIIDQGESDIMGWTSFSAIRINLWHGIPIKNIWRAQSSNFTKSISRILGDRIYDNITMLVSKGGWNDFRLLIPSEEAANNNFINCISKRQLKRAVFSPYPRVNFLRNKDFQLFVKEKLPLKDYITELKSHGYKIAIYMPTFRDTQKYKPLGASSLSDLKTFNERLKENHIVLLIKPHPEDKVFENLDFSNITMIAPNADVYQYLKYSDCLITDYSSIFFDYLVLNKPILFYVFDYDYYKNEDRGITVDFKSYNSGTISFNIEELCTNIINEISNDLYLDSRLELSKKMFDVNLPNLHERIITNSI